MKRILFVVALCASMIAFNNSTAEAHFPWLIINKEGKAALFFGENVADTTYKLPESISKAKVYSFADGEMTELKTAAVESGDFIGMVSQGKVADKQQLVVSKVTYGIYQGNRLNYYCMHVIGDLPKDPIAIDHAKKEGLYAEVVQVDEGIAVTVYWDGKPVKDAEVHLYCDEGHEEGLDATDEKGKVTFTKDEVEEGLNGIMFGLTRESESGSLDGKEYTSAMHYATITFVAK